MGTHTLHTHAHPAPTHYTLHRPVLRACIPPVRFSLAEPSAFPGKSKDKCPNLSFYKGLRSALGPEKWVGQWEGRKWGKVGRRYPNLLVEDTLHCTLCSVTYYSPPPGATLPYSFHPSPHCTILHRPILCRNFLTPRLDVYGS